MTDARRLEVHGRLDGEVDGQPVQVVGRGRTVEVTVPRLSVLREAGATLPARGGPARTALAALADAGLVVDVRTDRGHVASIGDVGRAHVRPGADVARPLAVIAGVVLAVIGALALRRRQA